MIWVAGTRVFNFPSSSVLRTDSIITYPDKVGVFPYFFNMTPFMSSSLSYPSFDTFLLYYHHFFPPFEGYLVVFTKLSASQFAWFSCLLFCAFWGWTVTSLSCLFFFFLGSNILGAAHLAQLTRQVGRIYSA